MTTRRIRRFAKQSDPGLVTWQPLEELVTARRRARWAVGILGAIAAMWVPAFFHGFHSKAFEGGVILECFTVVPLVAVVVRTRRLSRLIRRAKNTPLGDQ